MIEPLRQLLATLSTAAAEFAAHPLVQLGVLIASVGWLIVGGSEAALASTMTIGGFILTQMVLNQQRRRENALHLKIDELILAVKDARNEVAGAEHAAEEEIERLREAHGKAE
jgi:low affinity Fe/Cu permease